MTEPTQEQVFALVDADGDVFNMIVADQEFIDALPAAVADPNVETPRGLDKLKGAHDVTGKGVGIGDKRASNGRFVRPTPPAPNDPPAPPAPRKAASRGR